MAVEKTLHIETSNGFVVIPRVTAIDFQYKVTKHIKYQTIDKDDRFTWHFIDGTMNDIYDWKLV